MYLLLVSRGCLNSTTSWRCLVGCEPWLDYFAMVFQLRKVARGGEARTFQFGESGNGGSIKFPNCHFGKEMGVQRAGKAGDQAKGGV